MRSTGRLALTTLAVFLVTLPAAAGELVADYLERYFETYPSRATAAGRHDLDDRLEDLGPEQRAAWLAYNRRALEAAERLIAEPATGAEQRLDLELLRRQAELEVFDLAVLERPLHDPLYWSGLPGGATVFLLVRDDLPLPERLASAAARARRLPRLAAQARAALGGGDPARISPELCELAAGQTRASAGFYREGFAEAAGGDAALRRELAAAGNEAAAALDGLAAFLEALAGRATGAPRLGGLYAERFRIVAGVGRPVDEVLAEAERALDAKRAETAAYGRRVWRELLGEEPPPAEDAALVRRLFARVAADRPRDVDDLVAEYRRLIHESTEFVRRRDIVTLPEPLTLVTDRSPAFFLGQSVGGVYPAGPYASPEAPTLLFLPTPPAEASAEQRDAFFRDFNRHFNTMITPHEVIPGHYLQLKHAARHPHRVRALFGDGVYVEGWGTFCERLMLDLGWGGPLDRLAHLKKQMENIARTVVDIRVHTRGMTRPEVLALVRDEALQDEQFAANMWRRAIISSPQLTFYYLGYREVNGLYEDVREARGEAFRLKEFMDGMMEMGPVPVRHYRRRMLGDPLAGDRE